MSYFPARFVGGPWDGEQRALQTAPWDLRVAMAVDWSAYWLAEGDPELHITPKIGIYERDQRSWRYHLYMREEQNNPNWPIAYLWRGEA